MQMTVRARAGAFYSANGQLNMTGSAGFVNLGSRSVIRTLNAQGSGAPADSPPAIKRSAGRPLWRTGVAGRSGGRPAVVAGDLRAAGAGYRRFYC